MFLCFLKKVLKKYKKKSIKGGVGPIVTPSCFLTPCLSCTLVFICTIEYAVHFLILFYKAALYYLNIITAHR